MTSETSIIKATSERFREQIRNQFILLDKGKSPQRLISLIQQYELDSKCDNIDQELIYYLVIGYVIQNEWLALKHLTKRYHLNDIYQNLLQLSVAAINQELQQFCKTLFPKLKNTLKEKATKFTTLNKFDTLFDHTKIKYALNTFKKYYITFDLKTIMNTIDCKQQQIVSLGYKIEDGFVQFKKEQQITKNAVTQQNLLKKMKNLISVAQNMAALQ